MFNNLISMHQSMFVMLAAFFLFFVFRHLFVKTKLAIFVYHIILFGTLFILGVGGGGVQNDGYVRLEKIVELEKNHKLDDVKKNLQNDNLGLVLDLKEFKNSEGLRSYLKIHDRRLDKIEAIIIGWLLVLMFDLAMICVSVFRYLGGKVRLKFISIW